MPIARARDYRRVPWKNGQGVTREILRHPDHDGAFTWRLSLAEVVQSGPFSAFPGYERVITLLEGDGFSLRFGDGREQVLAAPHAPFHFDGAADVSCVLRGGPSQDLNLMVRRDLARPVCEVIAFTGARTLAPVSSATRLIVCLSQGLRLRCGEGPAAELALWDTARFDPAETQAHAVQCESAEPAKFFQALIVAPEAR